MNKLNTYTNTYSEDRLALLILYSLYSCVFDMSQCIFDALSASYSVWSHPIEAFWVHCYVQHQAMHVPFQAKQTRDKTQKHKTKRQKTNNKLTIIQKQRVCAVPTITN